MRILMAANPHLQMKNAVFVTACSRLNKLAKKTTTPVAGFNSNGRGYSDAAFPCSHRLCRIIAILIFIQMLVPNTRELDTFRCASGRGMRSTGAQAGAKSRALRPSYFG
jgi:hypothetical protein